MRYVGRFAPSPTGPLHAGSLLAAVGSFLDARHASGQWLLRIDDLDHARCRTQWTHQLLDTLVCFALQTDADPCYQSTRGSRYAAALTQLDTLGLLFRCRCSRRELAAEGEPCCLRDCRQRNLPSSETSLRIDLSQLPELTTIDRSLGRIHFDPTLHRDLVVQRRDGIVTYQLAVVIDDADQGVTDVVRGADLLPSTAWQLALHHVLDLRPPRYLHLPVLVEADGSKLAKSKHSAALDPATVLQLLNRTLSHLRQPAPSPQTKRPSELLHSAALNWDPTAFAGLSEIRLSED